MHRRTNRHSFLTTDQSKYLDIWRGGAAIVVMVAHAIQIYAPMFPQYFVNISAAMAGGAVMIFFAISGFLIQKSIKNNTKVNFEWKNYAKSRLNRIIPVFFASLLLTIILYYTSPIFFASGNNTFLTPTDRSEFSLDGLLITAIFLNNFLGPALSANGPLWSLAYEFWYYVLAGLWTLGKKQRYFLYIMLALATTLTFLDKWFLILGTIWIGGYYISIRHDNTTIKTPKKIMWAFTLTLIVLVICAIAPRKITSVTAIIFQMCVGILFIYHLNNITLEHRKKESNLAQNYLMLASRYSYSIYAFHFPIILFTYGIISKSGSHQYMMMALGIATTIAISSTIGKKIEATRIFKK